MTREAHIVVEPEKEDVKYFVKSDMIENNPKALLESRAQYYVKSANACQKQAEELATEAAEQASAADKYRALAEKFEVAAEALS